MRETSKRSKGKMGNKGGGRSIKGKSKVDDEDGGKSKRLMR